MIRIATLSLKGGVGKTTTTYNLAGALASSGRRVLLVDADRQCNLSQGFWGASATRAIDPGETMAAILRGDGAFPEALIKPTGIAGIDLVAGSSSVAKYNFPEPWNLPAESQYCLRQFLDEVDQAAYDIALIDCPPDEGLCSWVSGTAADFLLVPLLMEGFSVQGLYDVHELIGRMQGGPNPTLEILGLLINRAARKAIHEAFEHVLRGQYGPLVFDAKIPDATVFLDSTAALKPVSHYKPKGEPAKAVARLAEEVLIRAANRNRPLSTSEAA